MDTTGVNNISRSSNQPTDFMSDKIGDYGSSTQYFFGTKREYNPTPQSILDDATFALDFIARNFEHRNVKADGGLTSTNPQVMDDWKYTIDKIIQNIKDPNLQKSLNFDQLNGMDHLATLLNQLKETKTDDEFSNTISPSVGQLETSLKDLGLARKSARAINADLWKFLNENIIESSSATSETSTTRRSGTIFDIASSLSVSPPSESINSSTTSTVETFEISAASDVSTSFSTWGEQINKTGEGEYSSVTFNVRTADVGYSENKSEYIWPNRAEKVMKFINESGGDFINLQEVNDDVNKKFPVPPPNGELLTQEDYIIKNLKSPLTVLPLGYNTVNGKQVPIYSDKGLMIIYNPEKFIPVGQPVVKSLGFDHEGWADDKWTKKNDGEYNRQIIVQKFKIKGTDPERFVVQGNAHGPHDDDPAKYKGPKDKMHEGPRAVRNAIMELQKEFPDMPLNIAGDWNMDPEEMKVEGANTSAKKREGTITKPINWNTGKASHGNNDTQYSSGTNISVVSSSVLKTNLSDHYGEKTTYKLTFPKPSSL